MGKKARTQKRSRSGAHEECPLCRKKLRGAKGVKMHRERCGQVAAFIGIDLASGPDQTVWHDGAGKIIPGGSPSLPAAPASPPRRGEIGSEQEGAS